MESRYVEKESLELHFVEVIKKIISLRNLNQKTFGLEMGWDAAKVTRIMRRETCLSSREMDEVLRVFDFPLEVVLDRKFDFDILRLGYKPPKISDFYGKVLEEVNLSGKRVLSVKGRERLEKFLETEGQAFFYKALGFRKNELKVSYYISEENKELKIFLKPTTVGGGVFDNLYLTLEINVADLKSELSINYVGGKSTYGRIFEGKLEGIVTKLMKGGVKNLHRYGGVKELGKIPEEGSSLYTIYYDLKGVPTEIELMEGFKNLLCIYKKIIKVAKAICENDYSRILVDYYNNHPQELAVDSERLANELHNYKRSNLGVPYRKLNNICNPKMKRIVLKRCGNSCDGNCETRVTTEKGTNKLNLKVTYFIPLEARNQYDGDLDCEENMLALCPNCASILEDGNELAIEGLIQKLYEKHSDRLEEAGINLTLRKALKHYIEE